MTHFFKKTTLSVLVLMTAWLGITVGQNVTKQVFFAITAQNAHAAPKGKAQAATGAQGTAETPASTQERYENLELFQKVISFIENYYVEPVKNKDLIYGAIKGMVETLDPHSTFLTPEILRDMKIDTSGKFGGLGIEIGMKDNILTVISPIEDTPAWKAGLKPGDRIVKINTESTKGLSLQEAVNKMRGKPKTDVTLAIYREGFDKIKDVTVTRDIIKIQSVKFEELEPGYAWIRLASFNETASADIKKAIAKIESKGTKLKGLVFDMRMNPGGLLDEAVKVSELFIEDLPVVSTRGRNKNLEDVKFARKGIARKDFQVAVLVNSSSASAAEIVAGALQDHRRAIVMGQPTFGKGSVQQVIELGSDLGLKLTIQRYYTPSGRSIQEKGVQPDILLDDYDPKLLADAKRKVDPFREKDLKGHMSNPDEGDAAKPSDPSKEFRKEELESMISASKRKKGDKSDSSGDKDDEWAPLKFTPKDDYQIQMALSYLKSFDVFKKISGTEAKPTASAR